ncbi:MAG: acetoacetate decarboxylase family protein [Alphaproteobacteria bacterium]|jgi:acetoacetate decarboxylase|nr:acetoacetate decarboxylase family protein [Alphaproteobacteria bacterium]MDP6567739.1 acetoacetate decarboxylase family protein [Alphaproteobacteria bacterium]MDP6815194.1 acetoacetate decarboxylase family protein [Alphaproteobacteria bacterium]
MGFVKTAAEIAAIERVLKTPRFTPARRVHLQFRTTPEFVAAVMPPGLEAEGDPVVAVTIGRFGSNCCGDFDGATVSIPARHGDVLANYVLTMFMSTDHAIVFGRDLFGEPKKQAAMSLEVAGDRIHGRVERLGVTLIDLSIELGGDVGPALTHSATFNIKALPSADGIGLEDDAILTLAEFDNELTVNRGGSGRLALAGTVHDPLHEIPVLEVVAAGYVEGDFSARCRAIDRIPAAEFLPYAYGRLDDWSALDTSGAA